MDRFEEVLKARRVLVADGAWGTELAKRGLGPGEVPEVWNATRPDDVRAVAESYVAAGAEIILTNTFGGSRLKLARAGLAARTPELNLAGAELSAKAAAGRALVFGSVGPTGEMLEPYGELREEQALAAFGEQVRWLAAGGVNCIVIETKDTGTITLSGRGAGGSETATSVVSDILALAVKGRECSVFCY